MTRGLDIKFDEEIRIVGLMRLKDGVEMDSELKRVAGVCTWQDGFALLADKYFLAVPHEEHGDYLWCFAENVGKGPEGWNEVRKFASCEAAIGFLEGKSMLAR